MTFSPSSEQRGAAAQAADLLANQAEGLRLTGSVGTVAALNGFVATLRKIAASPQVTMTAAEKIDVEQASFLLEGNRDGLLTADFTERADKINAIIRTLNSIVAQYNAAASSAPD
jgi:hypothetical protein